MSFAAAKSFDQSDSGLERYIVLYINKGLEGEVRCLHHFYQMEFFTF